MPANAPPIIVKKIKKSAHAHHGGAWKVAYADFVTAMMAFFLLLWLLNATTDDQKRGIADYFTPATVSKSKSGAGGILGGQSISSPGARQSASAVPSASVRLKPTSGASNSDAEHDTGAVGKDGDRDVSEEAVAKAMAAREEARFAAAEKELRQAIENVPDLKELKRNLVVDRTTEGLRIQIVDQEKRPMFPVGSAQMPDHTRKLIAKIAQVVVKLPNKIAVSGHTDATPFRGTRRGYGNWELSSDRALASRRALVEASVPMQRIARVVGRADTDPLVPEDPASPRNRRISIVLLREVPPTPVLKTNAPEYKRDWTGPRLR